jgi:hypothetical protein
MKRVFKYILLTCLILFIIYILICVALAGGVGQKPWYYLWKGIYRIQNPNNIPVAEIVIDLYKTSAFIQNNTKPDAYMHPYTWWTMEQQNSEDGHLGLQSYMPRNPFSYLNMKIILNDISFTIPNFLILYINFKDYYLPEVRAKHPELQGINSIKIYCIECQPTIKNGTVIQRKLDYDFAIEQHKKLASIFDSLGFTRDANADGLKKIKMNKDRKIRNHYSTHSYLEYKNWVKDNFEFTLILEAWENEFINNIYIYPKEPL